MPLTSQSGKATATPKVDWADPGYFSGSSVVGNTVRLMVQLVRPPRGHRTLPTKAGMLLILITIGVGTAAFNSGQNILYLALSMLLSTLLVNGLLSWWNFKGCRWRMECGRHFRAGESSPVYVLLENTKKRLPSYSLSFELMALRNKTEASLALDRRLDPGASCRLQWDFTPARRGSEVIVLKGLVSRYPFGFLKKLIRDSYERRIRVWPQRIDYTFSAKLSGRRAFTGSRRRPGEGVELVRIRDYRSGDPLKRIHWKATARVGSLQVRETEQEHHEAYSLVINPAEAIWRDEAQFEKMCSFAASLAEDLFKEDQLRAVHFAEKESVHVGAAEDMYRILDTFSEVERGPRHATGESPGALKGNIVRFLPGSHGEVLAKLEDACVGKA